MFGRCSEAENWHSLVVPAAAIVKYFFHNSCSSNHDCARRHVPLIAQGLAAGDCTRQAFIAVSPDCELCASSMITATFQRVRQNALCEGDFTAPVSLLLGWLLGASKKRELFCNVVMMIGAAAPGAWAGCCESLSIFSTDQPPADRTDELCLES